MAFLPSGSPANARSSFTYMDVGKEREQDALSFTYMDVGKEREQDVSLAKTPLLPAGCALLQSLAIAFYLQHLINTPHLSKIFSSVWSFLSGPNGIAAELFGPANRVGCHKPPNQIKTNYEHWCKLA